MASRNTGPIVVRIPVNTGLVQQAYSLLNNRRVRRSEENFTISTEIVDHADINEYTKILLRQYGNADKDVKNYIERLPFNNQGEQFAKAIIIGSKNEFSVSVIATTRERTGARDQHKILVASMKKVVDMTSPRKFFNWLLGTPSAEQRELEQIVSSLHDEGNKQCLEAMAFYVLGDKIRTFLGNNVQVQFIQQNP